ncbi:RNA-binding motif protein, X-linked 2-like [Antechinus flavipes]|uniref:RNA-binding motif protein, X-linked 2-like n=1 Tax=Antechinus flavipes TaxID=38775 RepID=UPI0022354478|nr:RNA-binding motif protein, X-linked 2-like [Antechinus flavipes]
MNALTKVKLINELNQREVELGVAEKVSWHAEYKDSAWIFLGGLPYELTEGDIICVFSQYGEIVNINLVRDKKTGKSKGFCFLCYEDQRSTILAIDNFNGIKIRGRTIRVDHVANYRPPKDSQNMDDVTRALWEKGCGVKTPSPSSLESSEDETPVKKHKKDKKEKKRKNKDKDIRTNMDKQEMPTSSSVVSRHKTRKEKESSGLGKSATGSLDKNSSPERREGHRHLSSSPVFYRSHLREPSLPRGGIREGISHGIRNPQAAPAGRKGGGRKRERERSRSSEKHTHLGDDHSEGGSKRRHKHR